MNDWEIKSLDQVSEIVGGGTPDTNNPKLWDGTFNWITPNDLNKLKTPYIYDSERKITKEGLTNSSAKSCPSNTLVLSTRAPIGYLGITTSEASTNQGCKSIVFKNQHDPLFFYYLLSLSVPSLINLGTGTTFAELSKKDLESFTLRFPKDKFEQTSIAKILSTVDTTIEQTEKLIAKYLRIKSGLMQDLLTKGIDEQGNIRSEKTHKFKNSPLGRIPVEWEVKRIIDLAKDKKNAVQTGPFGAQLHSSDYVESGIPLLLIRNLVDGKINLSNLPFVTFEKAKSLERYRLAEGDIIFSRVGDVGRVVLATNHHIGWLISGQLLRVRLSGNISNGFLSYFLNSRRIKEYLKMEMLGSTRDSINTSILENMFVLVPPQNESDKIYSSLSKIDETIKEASEVINKNQKLKSGLMQDLLTGKVKVPNRLIEETNSNKEN